MKSSLTTVERALDEIRAGRMIILVDDEDRENEGDLVLAAEKVTPESINFMATHGRGLICLALTGQVIDKLELPMMVRNNRAAHGTAFTVSIEARHGVSTGISARDRATTIATAIADDASPDDVISPGHVFPLKAQKGGVLVRTGQTEGSVDLARMAGLKPAGVICEIMREDGEMARMPELEEFARTHQLVICTVADLVSYRLQQERSVTLAQRGMFRPSFLGPGLPFAAELFHTEVEDTEYLALTRGDVRRASAEGQSVLVRVHSLCPVADALGGRSELQAAARMIDAAGLGVLLVVQKKDVSLARGFHQHILQHALDRDPEPGPMAGHSEVLREFGLGAQVLRALGCHNIRLLSNSERKIVGLEGFGIQITERVAIA